MPEEAAEGRRAPVLTSVALVVHIRASLEALRHVALSIEAYLDHSWRRTKESASQDLHLLDRLLPHEHLSLSPAFRRERFLHGTIKAAADGNLQTLNWWTTTYLPDQPLDTRKFCKKAARNGHLAILQWLEEKALLPAQELQYLVSNHAQVVYWLHARPHLHISVSVPMDSAETSGDLEQCSGSGERARGSGHDQVATGESLGAAGGFGPVLHSPQYGFGRPKSKRMAYDTYPYAIWELPEPLELTEGHLRVARWLSTEYQWTKSDSYSEMAGQWPQKTAMRAAAGSNFEMIRIVRGCDALDPHDSIDFGELAWMAAFFGHLEMVQWLHEEDNACQTQAMRGAAVGGHLHIIRWLQQQKYVCWLPEILDLAAWGGHLDILQWMHQTHEPFSQIDRLLRTSNPTLEERTRAMDGAAGQGHLQVVRWLHENRRQGCTVKAMDDAAANDHFHVVQYLHEHRTEGCSTLAMDQAASNGHLEIVKFLYSHRHEGHRLKL